MTDQISTDIDPVEIVNDNNNDPFKAQRDELVELQMQSLREKDQELFRLRQQIETANVEKNKPAPIVAPTEAFLQNPEGHLAALESKLARMMDERLAPINQQAQIFQRNQLMSDAIGFIKGNPTLSKLYDQCQSEIDGLLRNTANLDPNTVTGAVYLAYGNAAANGKLKSSISANESNNNPSIDSSNRPAPVTKDSSDSIEIKKYIANMTETDRALAKRMGMTPEQAAKAVLSGIVDSVSSVNQYDGIFGKKGDK